MGLGKTLTVIALILSQKKKKEEKDTQLEGWISKTGKQSWTTGNCMPGYIVLVRGCV